MNKPANRVLLVVVAVIFVLAVVAGVVAATSQATEYDRDTPEGVVQAYLTAVIENDTIAADGYLAEDSECDTSDFEQAYLSEDLRVVLRDAETSGDEARVRIDVAMSPGGLFGGSERFDDYTLRLAQEGGEWRIVGSPWPLFDCGFDEGR